MSAVAAAIFVSLVLYTMLTLGFRKPGPSHEPYAEAQQRQTELKETSMLEWTRFPVAFGPSTEKNNSDSETPLATVTSQPTPERLDKALPVELVLVTPTQPSLYPRLAGVQAKATVPSGESFVVVFAPADEAPDFGEPWVFAKDNHLHIFLQDENRMPKNVTPVPPSERMALSLDAGALAPGEWTAAVYTAETTFNWTFTVE